MDLTTALTRRTFLRLGASAAAASLTGCSLPGDRTTTGAAAKSGPVPLSGAEAFNYIVGTQTIGATYQFTEESVLVETARAILDMGSNLLKFTMGRDYQRMMIKPSKAAYPETMQYLLNQGSDARNTPRVKFPGASVEAPPANPAVQTLTDLARIEPAYRKVLAMPFAYYVIWTYAFTPRWWLKGFSAEDQDKEYREIYAFVAHLLKTYNGTGKTFFLGHWEGDWHLRPDLNTQTDAGVTPESIQGMIDWLNTRQRAVDDAKRRTPHHGVQVYHYAEVNHVSAVMAGRPSVTNRVLPRTNVDFVSYSAYDSLDDIPNKIPRALDYIESKLPPKAGIAGKRVFIGEYGFAARTCPEPERDRRSRQVMRIGLEWGCPFVLCWQMYNNEFSNGVENGYWLIDNHGVKQPLWHTLADFYREARRYVADCQRRTGRLPAEAEFRRFAITLLG
ncbi:MAG: hypothetical protein ABSD29_17255 [Verrucomicrobiota bacterium]|jgi:hypothetical protein